MPIATRRTGAQLCQKLRARVAPFALLLLCLAPVAAQTATTASRAAAPPVALPPPGPGWAFPTRQTLTYAVDWRVFPAGTATVQLESDANLERITVTGDSQGAINLLFHVSDRFQSSFDRTTGCSQSFTRQIMEGHRQVNSEEHIDAARRTASYNEQNVVSHINLHQSVSIPPCVTDMLSGIYYSGSQPLEPGTVFHLPVVSGDHVSNVTMRVEARELVHTPTTSYHTVRVEPTADTGAIRNRGKVWIWYSDDSRHIPVQMRARLFWGTLTFRLTGIDTK
jgi:hypothetical protein